MVGKFCKVGGNLYPKIVHKYNELFSYFKFKNNVGIMLGCVDT